MKLFFITLMLLLIYKVFFDLDNMFFSKIGWDNTLIAINDKCVD